MLNTGAILALGAMSGTSLDGVDAAVVVTDGHEIVAFGPTEYRSYREDEVQVLRAALGFWPVDAVAASVIARPVAASVSQTVARATALVEAAHVEVLRRFGTVDLIGFHGQTLVHDPRGSGTHQVGSGARLAVELGLPVVWDFRRADVEQGGEGAPLAPFFHFACAKWIGALEPVCFLNLGGVGNMTWVDPRKATPDLEGALLAFDTGPANAPINDLVHARLGLQCDKDGALAGSGAVSEKLVNQFMTNDYFVRIPPKSLDRNDFINLLAMVDKFSDCDAAATLTAMVAESVACAIRQCPTPPQQVFVTGGGRLNPVLMAQLVKALSAAVLPVEAVGLNGDMLEAQAFAYLAVRVARGLPTSAPGTTGVKAPISGGRFSWP
ncbi:MAG: anhydro-N-acetylmuramic acid kinase [Paracoccaceae bacterium]|nr:anhydro-N-acetylmuramic acid kinase [Paracoccaceae bacterium]